MRDEMGERLMRWDAYLDGQVSLADAYDEDLPVARYSTVEPLPVAVVVKANPELRIEPAGPLVAAGRALAAYKVNDSSENAELRRYLTVGLNAGMAQDQASSWALEVFWNSENRKPVLTCSVIPPENPRFTSFCNAAVATVAAVAFASSGGLEWLAWILLHWRLW